MTHRSALRSFAGPPVHLSTRPPVHRPQVYNADPNVVAGETMCGCVYMGHKFAKQAGPPVFTMERDGCTVIGQFCFCAISLLLLRRHNRVFNPELNPTGYRLLAHFLEHSTAANGRRVLVLTF